MNEFECGQCLKEELRRHRVEIVYRSSNPSSQWFGKRWKLRSCFGSQLMPKSKDTRFRMQPKIKGRHLKDCFAGRKEAHDSVQVGLFKQSAFHFITFL